MRVQGLWWWWWCVCARWLEVLCVMVVCVVGLSRRCILSSASHCSCIDSCRSRMRSLQSRTGSPAAQKLREDTSKTPPQRREQSGKLGRVKRHNGIILMGKTDLLVNCVNTPRVHHTLTTQQLYRSTAVTSWHVTRDMPPGITLLKGQTVTKSCHRPLCCV
jgi:hypothetical protein